MQSKALKITALTVILITLIGNALAFSLSSMPKYADNEWYIIADSQYNGVGDYEKTLVDYVNNNDIKSASARLKYALALAAVGSTDPYIAKALEDSVGRQGIMSYVFALHLVNNGYTCEYTADGLIDKIISLRHEDGGFSVTGNISDVDTTAMTLQALAPYREKIPDIIDSGIAFLQKSQQPDGTFKSYGVSNAESVSQVIITLSTLGTDCKKDTRFIKNNRDMLSVLSDFRLADGSFCHEIGGESNTFATVQAFCALVSYTRMTEGKSPLYILDNANPDGIEIPSVSISYKVWVCIAVAALTAVVCLILALKCKFNVKNFAFTVVIALGIMGFTLFTDIQPVGDYYTPTVKTDIVGTVTISICFDDYILEPTQVGIAKDETVYDILRQVTAENKIHLETNGSSKSAYVEGIANIYEFDYGDLSGWNYTVNEKSPSLSCGEYKLSDGDVIEWVYKKS